MTESWKKTGTGAVGARGGEGGRGGLGKWTGLALVLVVAGVLIARYSGRTPSVDVVPAEGGAGASVADAGREKALPRLIDLGAHSCVPCKMMAPILEELKKEYADVFTTEFLDVWKDPEPGRRYGVRAIPTQIFFDAKGNELFRHEGYLGKEDILNTWRTHGVDVGK